MRKTLEGLTPTAHDSAFISEQSYLIGDVTVGERASCWPFSCLRGDGGPVRVGNESNVQEFSVLHSATVGEGVTVAHNVTLDYATVEDDVVLGIGSVLLRGATVESESMVAAGALVGQDQTVPQGHLAYGVPAETRPLPDAQREQIDYLRDTYLSRVQRYKDDGGFE